MCQVVALIFSQLPIHERKQACNPVFYFDRGFVQNKLDQTLVEINNLGEEGGSLKKMVITVGFTYFHNP